MIYEGRTENGKRETLLKIDARNLPPDYKLSTQ